MPPLLFHALDLFSQKHTSVLLDKTSDNGEQGETFVDRRSHSCQVTTKRDLPPSISITLPLLPSFPSTPSKGAHARKDPNAIRTGAV